MKILVTGAKGFIGKNLILSLTRNPMIEVVGVDVDSSLEVLNHALDVCEIVFHLAGINRPEKEADFEEGNVGPLDAILSALARRNRRPLIVLSSSVQASLDNPYGRSKKRAEDTLLEYANRTGTSARIFRLPGVFGKWCRPNYNSVVATFCHNIARGIPIEISDPAREIEIVHVDDLARAFSELVGQESKGAAFATVSPSFQISLRKLVEILYGFQKTRETLSLTDLSEPLLWRLFGTYVSYLPSDGFSYCVESKSDQRGVLAELLKASGYGQFFVSRTKPGVTRGNHYHDIKVEKFIVLQGDAVIRFRNVSTDEYVEYDVSGTQFRIVDIPPGWTHSIENVGSSEMIVLFWSSGIFDPAQPDTYAAEVLK